MKRIVILAPNWLGDVAMALPAMRDLRRHFEAAHVTIAARPSVAKVFRGVQGMDEVLTFEAKKRQTQQLAAGHFDVAILFPNSFRSAWIVRRAGIPQRWGYRSDFRSPLLTKAVSRPRHQVPFGEYYQELVRQLGVEVGPLTPRIDMPPAIVEASRALLHSYGWEAGRPLVGIAPGAAFGHAKRWPAARFARLISMAREEHDAMCVVLGREDDRDASQAIESALGNDMKSVINLVGRTDLLTFMGVISHCSAIVANDSGALHLAAAMGIAVVAIYGPTTERFSTPLTRDGRVDRVAAISHDVFCRPCWLRECPIDHRCMKRIPPERVYASLNQLLRQESHA